MDKLIIGKEEHDVDIINISHGETEIPMSKWNELNQQFSVWTERRSVKVYTVIEKC